MTSTNYAAMLAGEIERRAADLAGEAQAIVDEPEGSETLTGAVEVYCAQVERTRDAASLIGLEGLATCAAVVASNVRLLERRPSVERAAVMVHLAQWSGRFVDWLDAMDAPAPREALVALVTAKVLPQPADEASARSIALLLAGGAVTVDALLESYGDDAMPDAGAAPGDEDLSIVVPSDCDARVLRAFLGEAPRQAETLATLLGLVVSGAADAGTRRAARRAAHTLKGSAATVGVRAIATLAHGLEGLLETLPDDGDVPDDATSELLLDGGACIAQLVQALVGRETPPEDMRALAERLHRHALERSAARSTSHRAGSAVPAPAVSGAAASVSLPASAGGAEEATVSMSGAAPAIDAPSLRVSVRTVDEMFRLLGDLGTRVGRLQATLREARDAARTLRDAVDGVDARGDALLARALGEIDGAARTIDARLGALANDAVHHERIQRELGRLVVSTRMLPAATLVPRLSRNMRQTCRQLGREAALHVTGEEILLDGEVLEALADPLLHLLRNAVDHGVEPVETRRRLGKPDAGLVTVRFGRRGPVVTVTVRDDGPGLDYAAIQRRAVERGLVRADATPTRAELARLIFASGFSTRDAVSTVSGRGIGMDVVYERLAAMKGTVDIVSEPGQGCAITLRFQATLVAQHALVVLCAGETLALPSHLVEIALAPDMAGFVVEAGRPAVVYQGAVYRLYALAALAGFDDAPMTAETLAGRPLVLVRDGDRLAALACDRLLDSRELVVQRMAPWFRHVPVLAGAVVLASGRIAPVVDVGELVRAQLARERAPDLAPGGG